MQSLTSRQLTFVIVAAVLTFALLLVGVITHDPANVDRATAAVMEGTDNRPVDRGVGRGFETTNPAVWWWGDEAGEATVRRTSDRITAEWHSSVDDLTGKAMTLWIVVFNQPHRCTTGPGVPRCTDGDIFLEDGSLNDAVGVDFLYADGVATHIDDIAPEGTVFRNDPHGVTGTGLGELVCAIRRLNGIACDPDDITTPGLTNPLGAEVHLVLHNHGDLLEGEDRAHQLATFLGGCADVPAPFPTGPDTFEDCQSVQISIHQRTPPGRMPRGV